MVDTLGIAAVAVIKQLKEDTTTTPANKGICTLGGMSPGKKVELCSQYLKQLKEIQVLKDEGVLTLEEFQAEKDSSHSQRIQIKQHKYIQHTHSFIIHICIIYCVQSDCTVLISIS